MELKNNTASKLWQPILSFRTLKQVYLSILIFLTLACIAPAFAQVISTPAHSMPISQEIELCEAAKNAGYLKYETYLLNPKDFQVLQLQPIVQPYLARLNQALMTKDIDLVTLVLPPRSLLFPELNPATSVSYYQLIRNLEQAGLKTISVSSVFERTKVDFFFHYDHHWTPFAANETAKEIANVLDLDESVKQKFISSSTQYSWKPYNSRLKALSKLCGREYVSDEDDYLSSWTTTMAASEGLFDTRAGAFTKPSVLLGTSNSESSTLNFAGFLSEHTGQSISNQAFSSSGALGSMFYYFLSEEYQTIKPRYIFWEFLANPHTTDFNLNAIRYYRQIIPSIYGSCQGTALATNTFNLSKDVQREYLTLFAQDTSLTPVSNSDFYLSFNLSGDALDRIIVDVEYNTGLIDQSTLALLPSVKGHQTAYLEFLDNNTVAAGQVRSIHLTFPPSLEFEAQTKVSIDLCKKS